MRRRLRPGGAERGCHDRSAGGRPRLSEIAIIAGLPQAPSVLNPVRSPSRARARRNIVLGRMLAEKYIRLYERMTGTEVVLPGDADGLGRMENSLAAYR